MIFLQIGIEQFNSAEKITLGCLSTHFWKIEENNSWVRMYKFAWEEHCRQNEPNIVLIDIHLLVQQQDRSSKFLCDSCFLKHKIFQR